MPGLTDEEQAQVTASTARHQRSRQILHSVVSGSGPAGMEQPQSATSWLQHDNIDMLREWAARCSHVGACAHGMDVYKSGALYATFESIAQLACTCSHPPGSHTCIAGARVGDKYLSKLTITYPPSLASRITNIFAPFVNNQGWQNASIADLANLLPQTYVPGRMKLCDGAGMQSNADHTFPRRSKLKSLADKWWQALQDSWATDSAMLHLSEAKPGHPFSTELQERMAAIAAEELLPASTCEHATQISPGQPYRLRLLLPRSRHGPCCNAGRLRAYRYLQRDTDQPPMATPRRHQLQQCTGKLDESRERPRTAPHATGQRNPVRTCCSVQGRSRSSRSALAARHSNREAKHNPVRRKEPAPRSGQHRLQRKHAMQNT